MERKRCRHCGEEMPEREPRRGLERKFCSEFCRREYDRSPRWIADRLAEMDEGELRDVVRRSLEIRHGSSAKGRLRVRFGPDGRKAS